jgi:uncharacterized protein (DUF362 family)
MDRRQFIKFGVGAGIGSIVGVHSLAGSTGLVPVIPDMVAVRNGEPGPMLDAAMKAIGGMGRYVKRGQRVCIKPNIAWNKGPEMAANTNPELVKRAVEHCLDAGAREVVVFDHTCHRWDACYRNSGIEQAVKDAGGKMLPGNDEMYYQEVEIPGGSP